jgi:branched-chain amino acid transport system ATP-binding protein
VRRLRERVVAITAPHPVTPLAVLFGLNAVDELDRQAFVVLLPEIRDAFGLSNQAGLTLVAITTPLVLLIGIPVAHLADRRPRLRLAAQGATTWTAFSTLTGAAPTLPVLIGARLGSAVGRSVNLPTHNSLLADYYPPEVRARAYSTHQAADNLGRFLAPLLAGAVGLVSWRLPFILFALPTLLLVVALRRLEEPRRGRWERAAVGVDETAEDAPAPFREAVRILYGVRTLRRMYVALPFIAGALIGMLGLLSIFYEEEFGVDSLGRGIIFAFDEPVGIVGLLVLTPRVQQAVTTDVVRAARLIAYGILAYGGIVALIALSPVLPMAVALQWARGGVGAILLPAIYTIMSLIVPPRARSLAFTLGGALALFGLVVLPVAGGLADAGHVRLAIAGLFPMLAVGSAIVIASAKCIPADVERLRAQLAAGEPSPPGS